MRSDIVPGGLFPDSELPHHVKMSLLRTISFRVPSSLPLEGLVTVSNGI
jgi:hypothetical protein